MPLPPKNTQNALGQAALLQSRCRERPRSSRPARPPSMSASRGTCRPRTRRPANLRTPCPLASRRPDPWRKLSRLGHRAAHRQVNLDAPHRLPRSRLEHSAPPFGVARKKSGQAAPVRGVARNGSEQAAPVRGVAQNGSGQAARSAALPRMAQDRLPRSAAPPGMGQDRLSKLVRSPRTTPDTLSQPRRGIFETASSFAGELTDKGRELSHQDLAEGRGFASGRPQDQRGLASVAVSTPVPFVRQTRRSRERRRLKERRWTAVASRPEVARRGGWADRGRIGASSRRRADESRLA
jgi:hypothetical protein